MNKNQLGIRLKELRHQKGMTQEFLADESGLSLRTIQRIENGESNPMGDSLKRLANALNVSPDELIDWSIREDYKYLQFLNLSALSFLVFPLLGILIPFILWTSKKGKIKNIDQLGKDLINFQITWTIFLFIIPLILFLFTKMRLVASLNLRMILTVIGIMYFINLLCILVNSLRINNEKNVKYYSLIKFLG